jgi:hypothetical protein
VETYPQSTKCCAPPTGTRIRCLLSVALKDSPGVFLNDEKGNPRVVLMTRRHAA